MEDFIKRFKIAIGFFLLYGSLVLLTVGWRSDHTIIISVVCGLILLHNYSYKTVLVLSSFLIDEIISFQKLKEWTTADSEWKRRAVPVTIVELIKKDLKPDTTFPLIEPLMLDKSEYVQKGIGTLLRGLWKKYPTEIEEFLLKYKNHCGRLIVQYATEKMDKEYRKKFKKSFFYDIV